MPSIYRGVGVLIAQASSENSGKTLLLASSEGSGKTAQKAQSCQSLHCLQAQRMEAADKGEFISDVTHYLISRVISWACSNMQTGSCCNMRVALAC